MFIFFVADSRHCNSCRRRDDECRENVGAIARIETFNHFAAESNPRYSERSRNYRCANIEMHLSAGVMEQKCSERRTHASVLN
jgi:hypothetical protein